MMISDDSSSSHSEKVLFLSSSFQESKIAVDVLAEAGIAALACPSLDDLCQRLNHDYGALVMTDDSITREGVECLQSALKNQGAWSDIPIIVLTSAAATLANELFSKIGNVSLLEKPFSRLTLIRSVEVALRSRKRQYEIRDLLAALQRSKDEAERANVAKTEFLANMSHEIRTPIGAILGFLDLMRNPENEPDENLNFMGVIERNSQQLLRLIDDILDLSKVEAGKMTIESVQFQLTDLLADIGSIMAFRANEKGIGFRLDIDGTIPDQIFSDPVRIRQVIGNVIGNAIKFTQAGEVKFTVAFQDSFLIFNVTDTGIGVSKEQESKLFQPFSQADTSTTRKFGGTGLGLVLSRRLAEALGGSLRLARSQPGLGSTFEIRIRPQTVPDAKMVGNESLAYSNANHVFNFIHPQEQTLQGLKVLLVEDSPDNQMLITAYLQKSGALIRTADDGREGVEIASKENFDVVLMDLQMPNMDGHEATKRLRRLQYKKPIVALTAHAMNEQKKCFESGFSDFLTKPIERDRLMNVLSRYVPPSRRH